MCGQLGFFRHRRAASHVLCHGLAGDVAVEGGGSELGALRNFGHLDVGFGVAVDGQWYVVGGERHEHIGAILELCQPLLRGVGNAAWNNHGIYQACGAASGGYGVVDIHVPAGVVVEFAGLRLGEFGLEVDVDRCQRQTVHHAIVGSLAGIEALRSLRRSRSHA